MNKIIKIIVITILIIPILTGCWSKREIDEITLVTGIGIHKEGEFYYINVQVVNPEEVKLLATTKAPFSIFESKGKTLFLAIRRLTEELPRKIYWAHLQLLLISENVAEEGLENIVDLFVRDHEFRPDFRIAIVKDATPKQILQTQTHIDILSADKISNIIQAVEKSAGVVDHKHSSIYNIVNMLISDRQSIVIPVVTIEGEKEAGKDISHVESSEPETVIVVNNLAVFKGDKLVGWMDEHSSRGLNFILDNIKSTVVQINCEDNKKLVLEIIKSKTKLDVKINNDLPKISINVDTLVNIGEVQCKLDLMEPSVVEKIRINAQRTIEDEIKKALIVGRHKYKSDIFGFSDLIYKKDYKLWYKIESDWEEILGDIEVEIIVNVDLRNKGQASITLKE